jgi:diketogulonate reductase-like aldo/keto reductase
LVQYLQDEGVAIQAYSPLACGKRLDDPTLGSIAAIHGKSPAQVLIRWSQQKGWVPLPKSQNPERIRENANVLDFELGENDMMLLDGLDLGVEGAMFPFHAS